MQFQTMMAVGPAGPALQYPLVTVYLAGTLTPAVLYDDDGDPLGNPFRGTLTGVFGFAAVNGEYDIVVSSGSVTLPTFQRCLFLDWTALTSSQLTILFNAMGSAGLWAAFLGGGGPGGGGSGGQLDFSQPVDSDLLPGVQ